MTFLTEAQNPSTYNELQLLVASENKKHQVLFMPFPLPLREAYGRVRSHPPY